MSKVDDLLVAEGLDSVDEFLEMYAVDSVVPGICVRAGGSYVDSVEPDARGNWCAECQEPSVKSGLVLLGII